MQLFYDLRTDRLVTRPGTQEELDTITLKRGGEQALEIEFGRSAADGAAISVQSQPTWVVEQLSGSFEIWAGAKEDTIYEGDLVIVDKTFAWNATTSNYDGSMDMNTTALNALLLHDGTTTNDVPSVDLMFEVKYRQSGALPWSASVNQVVATVHHNVLDGDESTPAEAGDPTDYILATGATQITGIQEMLGLNLTDATELTISSGAVTATQGFHTIDTEADAASDDLATITAADGTGDVLHIYPASDARSVIIKDGTGNITTGVGDITLDTADKWCSLIYNGTNWLAHSNAASSAETGWQLILSQTASTSATIDFDDTTTTGISSAAYSQYKIVLEDVLTSNDAASLRMRVSDDGGASYEVGNVYEYSSQAYNSSAGDVSFNGVSSTVIPITGGIGTSAGEDGVCGEVIIYRPTNSTKTKFTYHTTYKDELTYSENVNGGALHNVAIATDGVQFLVSAGTIASGKFHLFGLKDV